MKDPRMVRMQVILSSLETAELISSRMTYASVAMKQAVCVKVLKTCKKDKNQK